jgi:nitrite reductase (NADH) large subunit
LLLIESFVAISSSHPGIEYLKEVIINDKLGICDELDRQMQHIVDTYQDEVRQSA